MTFHALTKWLTWISHKYVQILSSKIYVLENTKGNLPWVFYFDLWISKSLTPLWNIKRRCVARKKADVKVRLWIMEQAWILCFPFFCCCVWTWSRKAYKTTITPTYSLIQFKGYNSKFKFLDGVQFRKYFISLPAFYLIIWLMESPKNFEKNIHFERYDS